MISASVFDFTVPTVPGEYAKVYMAKITGANSEYVYQREFIPLTAHEISDGRMYVPVDFDDYGVYEISITWRDAEKDGKFLRRERYWLLMIDQTEFPIPQEMVLDTVQWLKHYERAMVEDDVYDE